MNSRESGVVYALCEQCSSEMNFDSGRNELRCKACGHTEARKISVLYNKPDEIKKLFG